MLTELLEVNVVALTQLTRLALPAMVERGYGYVLNVAVHRRLPAGAEDGGVLREQVLRAVVHRGGAAGGAGNRCARDGALPRRDGDRVRRAGRLARSRLFSSQVLDAAFVAREGYAGMLADRGVVIPGTVHHVAARLAQFSPHALTARFARRANESAS